MKNIINNFFSKKIETLINLADNITDNIENAVNMLTQCLLNDSKILIYGHGVSAANALQFSFAMTHKYNVERPALPCICLNHFLQPTEISNENILERQLSATANKGDCLIILTTNIDNPAIIKGISLANQKQIACIILHGSNGTTQKSNINNMNVEICINANINLCLIREIHLFILHLFCDLIEHSLFNQINYIDQS